jgi:ribosomal protein S11
MSRIGTNWVRATALLTERNFLGEDLFVHAEPGDIGTIIDVLDEEWATVLWEQSGTMTDCHREEYEWAYVSASARVIAEA